MSTFDVHAIAVPAFTLTVEPDRTLRFASLNAIHSNLTGLRAQDIVGRTPEECLPAEVAQKVSPRYLACVVTRAVQEYEEELELPNGRFWWRTTLTPLREKPNGPVTGILGLGIDITSIKLSGQELEASGFDPLTGAANARHLEKMLGDAVGRAASGGRPFSLVLARLAQSADACPEEMRKSVIVHVAGRLRESVRQTDTVAHLGEGRFGLLLSAATEGALEVSLDRFRRGLQAPVALGPQETPIAVEIGGTVFADGASAESLWNAAEADLLARAARRAPAPRADRGPALGARARG
ncbi:PAS domain-containing protein [Aurantimonas sp. Leaf443]|uniref:sensor domain-containing diguanylate cyclase n=1 Tax=Aurantimonas sp. Leaf443 TaxID=1736378 RepID=UPI0006F8485A|nr:PAS domain-containing protein [Aurantimonas sp. Leaf443]KQT83169.1 hypothetical protein ASG48_14485 [Aurantimonas sp. Leaf443]